MKPFEALTERGQVQRIKQMAALALVNYPLNVLNISLIYHGENTTFRATVEPDADLLPHADHLSDSVVLVRCHRPHYNTAEEINSELVWLAALNEAGVDVQSPIANTHGDYVTHVHHDHVPQDRSVTVMRWATGRFSKKVRPVQVQRLGRLTAQLHQHARTWTGVDAVVRKTWDADGLLNNIHRRPHTEEIWAPFSATQRQIQEEAIRQTRAAFDAMVEGGHERILIHSDLHFGNVLFRRQRATPIDFDDCGWGYALQDISTTIHRWDMSDELEAMLTAYIKGYTSTGEPEPDLTHMVDFFIARRAQMAFWLIERSKDVPKYREMLPKWLERNCASLTALLERTNTL